MSNIQRRKDQHIEICLERDVESGVKSGLDDYRLEYDALPEISLDEVDISVEILGKRLEAPIIIGSMTGGSDLAMELNRRLARVAARLGIGMALGSQRVMLHQPETVESFAVRNFAPDLPLLLGNIGAVQLNYGLTIGQIRELVEKVRADGLFFHLNPLQEAVQPEGDTDFSNLLGKLQNVLAQLPFSCLIKEVGAGISRKTANKLANLPLAGIEASGVGGTSWAKVESYRAGEESVNAAIGRNLQGFGVPTAEAIINCREAFPYRTVIASGGIRTGYHIAVAIALGADAVAIARPALEAVYHSEERLFNYLQLLIQELKVLCFCTGSKTLKDLRNVNLHYIPRAG